MDHYLMKKVIKILALVYISSAEQELIDFLDKYLVELSMKNY